MELPASYSKAIGACLIASDPSILSPKLDPLSVCGQVSLLLSAGCGLDDNPRWDNSISKVPCLLNMHFDFKGYGKKVAVSMFSFQFPVHNPVSHSYFISHLRF